MLKRMGNPCIRCGKERVTVKTWREYIGESLITYTTTTCPDPKCQKIVDEKIAAQVEKRKLLADKRAQSKQARAHLLTLHPPAYKVKPLP